MTWIAIIIFIGLPGLLIFLESSVAVIRWLSPAFWCYALGILLGMLIEIDLGIIESMQTATVALAIPLLLLSSNVRQWMRLAPKTALSYVIFVGCIISMAIAASQFYAAWLPAPAQMAAMASSVYTGGTANMAAVHVAIGADIQLFNTMNITDLLLSGSLLIVILSVAQRILLYLLPAFQPSSHSNTVTEQEIPNFTQFSISQKVKFILISILIGLGIVGICAGGSYLFLSRIDEILVVIGLALIGLAASNITTLRDLPGTYETGEYIFLIFCVIVGARVDLWVLLSGAPPVIAFMATVAFGSIFFHTLIAYFFKIDADTVLITQVAGIFGPPFIGPVANRLQNREIVVSGMTLGVINLAIGNFIGILVFQLLY